MEDPREIDYLKDHLNDTTREFTKELSKLKREKITKLQETLTILRELLEKRSKTRGITIEQRRTVSTLLLRTITTEQHAKKLLEDLENWIGQYAGKK
ncbi:MAG TPA: hypothetical protein VFE88_03475 [Candidatus Nanoarchaeia archaeon]|nr:hypothetical protein [Candidatus Nanoarchaeia archaeon]